MGSTDTTTTPLAGIAPAGFRMPAAMRLGLVQLQVANLARSLDWYQRVLGARVLERDERSAVLGGSTPLLRLHEHPGATPVPRYGRLGIYHYAILVPDRPSLGRFLNHASSLGLAIGMSDHLVSEALYLYDPDGLGIEVYRDRPREDWQSAQQQLVMRSDPLDGPGLISDGGDEPWSSIPEGTTIGHIHFFVPDLAKAEDFHHRGLGLDKMVWNYPGALFLAAGGYHHHVGVNTWAHHAQPASPGDARLLEWTIVLPDADAVEAVGANLAAAGYEVARSGSDRTVIDPFATVLRLTTP